jgi:Tol biopolymer transport system component
VALAFAFSGGVAAAAAPVPEGPRLAFTAMTTLGPGGFSVRAVGVADPRPLVLARGSLGGVVPNPFSAVGWSADGTKVAFAGSQGARNGIYTVRADGTGLRFLRGTRGGKYPVFSPDGSKIAFAREPLGKTLFFGMTPWVADADGSGAHRLISWRSGVEYLPSSFSPDASTLALTKIDTRVDLGSDKPTALLLKLDGSGGVRVLARRASEPVFSPDGSQIVFVRHSISRRWKIPITHKDLYVMSTDGMTSTPLTRTRWIAESHPSWDPSGQRIAFSSFRISKEPIEALFDKLLPFGNSIVQVNADGSCRQKVLSLRDTAVFGPTWQPGPGRAAGPIAC